jgi:hypothetical protein
LLVSGLDEPVSECIGQTYTPEEIVKAVHEHVDAVRAGSDPSSASAPLAGYYACFPPTPGAAETAQKAILTSLLTSFPEAEPPAGISLLALPDDVLSNYVILGSVPARWNGLVFTGDRLLRQIDYSRTADGDPVVLIRAFAPGETSSLTADESLALRIFLRPYGEVEIDPRGAVVGRTEDVVWAYNSGSPDQPATLLWSLSEGGMLWMVQGEDEGELVAAVEMLREVSVEVLRG